MIRVAAVEDAARIRNVLAELLNSTDDLTCVGLFSNGESAIAKLPALKPDVVIMDINLPDISGVDCVARLTPLLPDTQIIMLTVYQDPETIFRALAAGAHGYLVKPVVPGKLLEAIRDINTGGVPMSPSIARKVIAAFQEPAPRPNADAADDATGLGPRQRQVLNLLVAGYSYKEIADELDIKVPTVGTYVRRIYQNLHVRTRRELLALTQTSTPPPRNP